METVSFEERKALPKQIEVDNEAYVVGPAGGLEPVVRAENSVKTIGNGNPEWE